MYILLVEDNPGDVLLTEEMMEDLGIDFELKVITNGEEVISYLEDCTALNQGHFPDLVLLDINLPRKNGHQVMEFINSKTALQDIPVFMLTTSSASIDREKSKANNVSRFFTKPIDPHLFKTALENFILKFQ